MNKAKEILDKHITDHIEYGGYGRMIKLSDATKAVNEALNQVKNNGVLGDVIKWVAFDWNKPETRPPKYDKYFVQRKDGKIHWETWNGSGWAYNHNEIRYWAEIKPPCL